MKILIVSDTHAKNENLELVLEREKPIDLLIHLGDVEGAEDLIEEKAGCPFKIVSGNNDFFSRLNKEMVIDINGQSALITHGHLYNVSAGIDNIISQWDEVDIIMFGHTHRPLIMMRNGQVILNPGSLSYPRQDGRVPTFIIMDINDDGDTHYTLNYLK